jgi:release factor glutamine methyltransferase
MSNSGPEPNAASPGGTLVALPAAGERWTVLQLVRWSAEYLTGKGIEGGRLDAELLLADILATDRLHLYLDHDRPLEPAELERFRPTLLARARRKPLQYILGRTQFRELDLRTDPRALIPRPETEELVGAVLDRVRRWGRSELHALDMGTGTGAIALSLATEGPFLQVVGVDLSHAALDLARENRSRLTLESKVELREGNLFDPVRPGERFDVLVSNPPYVSEGEHAELDPEVRDWEPREALVSSGPDGTDLTLALVEGAADRLTPGGLLAIEVGEGRAPRIAEKVRDTGQFESPEILRDLARRERFVLAIRLAPEG